MLSATMALNGFIAMGVSQDWATHMIGHEITALHGLTHGHTLAIVLPATLQVLHEEKGDKLLQYGERVWGITSGTREERIDEANCCSEIRMDSLVPSLFHPTMRPTGRNCSQSNYDDVSIYRFLSLIFASFLTWRLVSRVSFTALNRSLKAFAEYSFPSREPLNTQRFS